jgi:hypothetical protein
MTTTRVDVIDRSVEKAHVWLNDLAEELVTEDGHMPIRCCARGDAAAGGANSQEPRAKPPQLAAGKGQRQPRERRCPCPRRGSSRSSGTPPGAPDRRDRRFANAIVSSGLDRN